MVKSLRSKKHVGLIISLLLVGTMLGIVFTNIQKAEAASDIQYAGVRSSTYGISPFPSPAGWANAINTMAGYWPGSQPTAIWIVGVLWGTSECHLEFPSDGGTYNYISFAATDFHEDYLDHFDTVGIKVFLQVEPGLADVPTLIDLVLNRYKHHSCVIGFGIDVEWHRNSEQQWGVPVTDAQAQAWESRVKSHNSAYRLFLKHFDWAWMPQTYKGNIVFVDDSQGFASLNAMVTEFTAWAAKCPSNIVFFQYGYEADKTWWQNLNNPPKAIGDAIDAAINQPLGVFWVDFTLRDVLPTEEDTTPPAAPTGLTATAVSSSQINLDWNDNTEADLAKYKVYRSTTSGFTPGAGTFVAETTVSAYSDTGLSASTTYYYKVTAVDTSGNEGSASNEASATTQAPSPNLALNRPAYASSYISGYGPEKAVDGKMNTRWSSKYSDPQWIYVDLGSAKTVGKVILYWEVAYGKAYKIQVSNDASTWTDVYSTTTGDGGTDTITFSSVSARYVRMYGTKRGTSYGYSLWEFEIYAGVADTTPPVISNVASSSITSNSAIITWNTDELSNSVVNYGTTTALGSTASSATMVTAHSVKLTGLSASTKYYYEVKSTDSSGNTAVDNNGGSYYTFTTAAAAPPNLALNCPAYASSYISGYEPGKAVDGKMDTRWCSQMYSDPQWMYVDLGSSKTIGKVVLYWEVAYGKAYKIQVSNDASTWTDVYSTTTGDGGTDTITFSSVSARYVRMYGTQRGTQWGYSIWEFEIYSS